ncbi:MAG: hypothetical protein ACYC5K_13825 [Saccharofermentanales bacterium]
MSSRETVGRIFDRRSAGEGAIWTGHPNDLTIPLYAKKWSIEASREAIFRYLEDDCRWYIADYGYKNAEGTPMFDYSYGMRKSVNLSSEGCFAGKEDISEIGRYP